jgi:hypothetical protein
MTVDNLMTLQQWWMLSDAATRLGYRDEYAMARRYLPTARAATLTHDDAAWIIDRAYADVDAGKKLKD